MKLQELGFRVWNTSLKMFGALEGEINGKSVVILPLEEIEIDLYTGLKDKSGNKIYDGDIIAHCVDGGGVEYHSKIEFNQQRGMFELVCIEHPVIETFDKLANPDIEVVGNIRENKDLLEL